LNADCSTSSSEKLLKLATTIRFMGIYAPYDIGACPLLKNIGAWKIS
jgi:hypothetical protein